MAEGIPFDNQDSELLQIFMEEAREQIETLDQGLVRLEREPTNSELIQGIFRAAHTLKGSSGAMGFRQMADLTHAMEDVLERVRSNTLMVNGDITDALLQGLDLLREMEQAISNGCALDECTEQAAESAKELRSLAKGEAGQQAIAQKVSILQALPEGRVGLLVNFAADCQMPSLRAYMILRALTPLGTLCDSYPSRAEIDQGAIGNRLMLVVESEATEEALRDCVLDSGEVEWVRTARGEAAAGLRLDQPAREENGLTDEHQLDGNTHKPAGAAAANTANGAHGQQTVRVGVDTLDRIMNLVGELVLDRTRVAQLKEELDDCLPDEELIRDLDTVSQHLGSIVGELHEQVLQARMLPVSQLFNRFPRLVRDISRSLGKEVEFSLQGESERLDRSVIENLVDPLTHILRNALDHGLEMPEAREAGGKPRTGTIILSAERQEEHVVIRIQDDGPGLNCERLKEKAVANGLITAERARGMTSQEAHALIFASGLSTAARVSDISGRGVGMDVVKRNIDALGGTVVVDSTPGFGSTFSLKIPLTLAIVRALLVKVGQVVMALPLSQVEETINIARNSLHSVRGRAILKWRDIVAPVVRLSEALPGCGTGQTDRELHLVVVRYSGQVVCLAVDAIMNHQEIVVKPLGGYLGEIPGFAGATILGNGRVALIVDIGKLFESGLLQQAAAEGVQAPSEWGGPMQRGFAEAITTDAVA